MVYIAKNTNLDRRCRRRFEAGDKTALLDAVDFCARAGLHAGVARRSYCAAYAQWAAYGARSLDQAFGVDRKGRKLAQLQKRESLKAAVVVEVTGCAKNAN